MSTLTPWKASNATTTPCSCHAWMSSSKGAKEEKSDWYDSKHRPWERGKVADRIRFQRSPPAKSYTFLAFVLLSAFFFAKLEIEIEGPMVGERIAYLARRNRFLLDLFFGGRPLTSYHVWSAVLFLFLFLMPFFFCGSWSVRTELNVLGGISYSGWWEISSGSS